MLDLDECKERQRRLLSMLDRGGLKSGIITSARLIYYFTGALTDPNWPQAFLLTDSGRGLLITNRQPDRAEAETIRVYTGYTIERPFGRHTMHRELADAAVEFLGGNPGSIGVELESVPGGLLAATGGEYRDLTPALTEMRRRKDRDELECMRETVRITEAGYSAIKEKLEPGMTEVDAYSVIHDAIVAAAGTSVDLKGDFACGVRAIGAGGPPTSRRVAAGELYIFDLFPVFEGYMCDLCRTFAVGQPTEEQQRVREHVVEAHRVVQPLIRPGARARTLYERIREHLDELEETRGSFTHHAGHGVGMEGWEQPWLNRGTDQVLIEGEVIACEPALYATSLAGGIRLEHNYLVTADGPQALDSFPMDL
jgi:Xaa-Pro dipeptidase